MVARAAGTAADTSQLLPSDQTSALGRSYLYTCCLAHFNFTNAALSGRFVFSFQHRRISTTTPIAGVRDLRAQLQ